MSVFCSMFCDIKYITQFQSFPTSVIFSQETPYWIWVDDVRSLHNLPPPILFILFTTKESTTAVCCFCFSPQVFSWTSIQLWLLIAVVLECRRFWQHVDQWGMYQCLGTNITCYSQWIFVNDIFNFLWTWWQIWLSVFCIIHF